MILGAPEAEPLVEAVGGEGQPGQTKLVAPLPAVPDDPEPDVAVPDPDDEPDDEPDEEPDEVTVPDPDEDTVPPTGGAGTVSADEAIEDEPDDEVP